MQSLFLEIGLFFLTLAAAGLFAFLETAFTSIRPFKIHELRKAEHGRYKKFFDIWESNPQRILVTVLVVNNFFHVLCSVTITEIMQSYLGDLGLAVGVVTATIMILVFGDIVPKTLAKTDYVSVVRASLWLMHFLVVVFAPVTLMLLKFARGAFKLLGKETIWGHSDAVSEKELKYLIDYSDEQGIIDAEKGEMLQNVFGLGEIPVSNVMIPQTDMVSLDINASIEQASEVISKHHFSGIPVFEGNDDNIVGIIYHKDLFDLMSRNEQKRLKEIVRPVLFVPETKKNNQLLNEFLKKRMHMAIVVDEFGAVIGLATLEDVIEEIVGEISDEHEKVHTGITELADGGWMINASIVLDNLEELLKIEFEVEDSLTLAGFLAEKMQHLPKNGETITY
ncbi:HlyC/CorC family transporter, partial [bacterium]|nr:HlyC/CorC family transporter [bacterium]